jgi:oligopeptide transport system ATP-binding protein
VSISPLLRVESVSKTFRPRGGLVAGPGLPVLAVDDVSFEIAEGESLALVGESGSGKTTTARMLVGLERPSAGRVVLEGDDVTLSVDKRGRLRRARAIQIVFQDPYTSLDPRQCVLHLLDEIQRVHFERTRGEREQRARDLLEAVGLGPDGEARPRELSGGQRQRAAIARALATEPKLVVLDEAVSALDVSIQAQILNLLNDLRRELGLAYLVISHDLAVVRQLSERVLVMRGGRVVESGPADVVLVRPSDPYTRRLLESIPRPLPRQQTAPAGPGGPHRKDRG